MLTGKCALVTGSTSGIGLDIARSLAELGAELVLFGRNRDQLATLEKELGARTLAVDITDEAAGYREHYEHERHCQCRGGTGSGSPHDRARPSGQHCQRLKPSIHGRSARPPRLLRV